MVDDLANLRLSNEEEDAFQEDAKEMKRDIKFSLVGTCLTNSMLHFSSFWNTMADLWHPIGGIAITNIGEKCYSFKFFHTVDMNKVLKGLMLETMAKHFEVFMEYDMRISSLRL
ncbi:hypothetical protein Gohar_000003 [Gossypium harknessii]|uniref:DUF4283 domain-containing protein n=1 Tax=Gossypium harknessii TaxID=34285 RepID=A0A7J9IDD7_9ROSI|nr:hypothetical protein [Gossypium harknessii]